MLSVPVGRSKAIVAERFTQVRAWALGEAAHYATPARRSRGTSHCGVLLERCAGLLCCGKASVAQALCKRLFACRGVSQSTAARRWRVTPRVLPVVGTSCSSISVVGHPPCGTKAAWGRPPPPARSTKPAGKEPPIPTRTAKQRKIVSQMVPACEMVFATVSHYCTLSTREFSNLGTDAPQP